MSSYTDIKSHRWLDANMVYCEAHLRDSHQTHGRQTHVFLQRNSDSYSPSWKHVQLITDHTIRCCHLDCKVTPLGKAIRFVSQCGQQRIRIAHSYCLTIHEALISIGYVAATSHKPELAFHMDMLTRMRELLLDAHLNIHRFCDHLRLRSYTNTLMELDSNVYSSLRIFYPQFSAQMNALESFSEDPHDIKRTYCVACRHNVDGVVTLTVDGNFSCKCKASQSQNPQAPFWNHGNYQ